ncbi:hypothetical protein [Paraliomyxa miuraensis]|uniref:hypothetical protein n=1 Tax=Paraliomyxa miuraensis TaxID=376150 RepID=UPI00225BFDD3|nr:hypothetical protein [Paraliomyxa miuraensis]MCX4242529.1 hypothetical protein [Paraliomyxa miuraensis]
MKRLIVIVWLAGCADGGIDDPSPMHEPDMGADIDVEKEKEECAISNVAAICPLSWAWKVDTGPTISASNPDFVELADVAEPVCNGHGLFAVPDDLEGATAGPEVTVVHNSQCRATCFPQCSFTSVCYAMNPGGRGCGHSCTAPLDLTREECEAFVAECIGDPTACE